MNILLFKIEFRRMSLQCARNWQTFTFVRFAWIFRANGINRNSAFGAAFSNKVTESERQDILKVFKGYFKHALDYNMNYENLLNFFKHCDSQIIASFLRQIHSIILSVPIMDRVFVQFCCAVFLCLLVIFSFTFLSNLLSYGPIVS